MSRRRCHAAARAVRATTSRSAPSRPGEARGRFRRPAGTAPAEYAEPAPTGRDGQFLGIRHAQGLTPRHARLGGADRERRTLVSVIGRVHRPGVARGTRRRDAVRRPGRAGCRAPRTAGGCAWRRQCRRLDRSARARQACESSASEPGRTRSETSAACRAECRRPTPVPRRNSAGLGSPAQKVISPSKT